MDSLGNIGKYDSVSGPSGTSAYASISGVNAYHKEMDSAAEKQPNQQHSPLLKGEIIDLKNNQITVRLEDGSKITANIYDGKNLNIGQLIRFQVRETPSGSVIENIQTHEATASTLVYKALEAANLPANDKNLAIAMALLKHGMSLDKNTILNIQKQSFISKNASIETLVLMTKNRIPFTNDNAAQFEKYCNYEHRIVKELGSVSDEISNLYKTLQEKASIKDVLAMNSSILNIICEGVDSTLPIFTESIVAADDFRQKFPEFDAQRQQSTDYSPSRFLSELRNYSKTKYDIDINPNWGMASTKEDYIPVSSAYLYPTAAKELYSIMSSYKVNPKILEGILDGTAALRDVAIAIRKCMETADEIDEYRTSTVNKNHLSLSHKMLAKDAFLNPVIQNILDRYETLQRDRSEVASYMNDYNRAQIISILRDVPHSVDLAENIWKGDISSAKLLRNIEMLLPNAKENTIRHMLSGNQYRSVIKEALLSNWTLSPTDLKKANVVEDTYQRIYSQLTKLDQLINANFPKDQTEHLTKDFNGTKNNLEFINTVNEMLTYVQLPLKMRNQNVHSDLYILTGKKNLKMNKKHISVLLHLDMEYLGPLDINIVMDDNKINAKFHVTTEETRKLFQTNMENLEFSLMERGFLLKSDVELKDKTVDLIDDFINKEDMSTSIKRYTFDVRT